jgi:hypothetical protein
LAHSVAKVGAAVIGVVQVDDGTNIVVLGPSEVLAENEGTRRLDGKRDGIHLLEAKVQAQDHGHAKTADQEDEGELALAARETWLPSTESGA